MAPPAILFLAAPALPTRRLALPPRRRHTPAMRVFWVQPLSPAAATAALESSLTHFFLPAHTPAPPATLGAFSTTAVTPDNTFPGGELSRIATPAALAALLSRATAGHPSPPPPLLVVDCPDWSAIPAENLLAAYAPLPTAVYAVVEDAASARAMLAMLQRGVDGVVLRTADAPTVRAFARLRAAIAAPPRVRFARAAVLAVRRTPAGERVCVDTCSLLAPGEGLLVGTSSRALFHVLSEAVPNGYVASRPFRVNAGPVHSYVALPDGRTAYLSELCAGMVVLAVGQGGVAREVVVGRAKIETRPLVMVSARLLPEGGGEEEGQGGEGGEGGEGGGEVATVFLQNAETVRLATDTGWRSVAQLTKGDVVLLRTDTAARHTGLPIEEDLVEQ